MPMLAPSTENASPKAPPTIGIALEAIILAALPVTTSDCAETSVCTERIPVNTVTARTNAHFRSL